MIRSSKHILKYQTNSKNNELNQLFIDYESDLKFYINLILTQQLPLKINLSSKLLPNNIITIGRWKQVIYKQASEIIRSQLKKASNKRFNNYKKIYSKCLKLKRFSNFTSKKFSELQLKDIIISKYFTPPKIENLTITIDNRFLHFQKGNSFDEFLKLTLHRFIPNRKALKSEFINIPIKQHKHSLKYSSWTRKNSIALSKINNNFYLTFFYESMTPEIKTSGTSLGIDQGYKKLLTCSDGTIHGQEMFDLYQKISIKKQGSKNFKQLLQHRDNEINRICNNLDLTQVNQLVIEDLKDVKHKSKLSNKTMNKVQRWSYKKTIDKLERLCEENGVLIIKVNPAYTSQTCSQCGSIHKENRNGEDFLCVDCGYKTDADYNASINILHRGIYSPSTIKT